MSLFHAQISDSCVILAHGLPRLDRPSGISTHVQRSAADSVFQQKTGFEQKEVDSTSSEETDNQHDRFDLSGEKILNYLKALAKRNKTRPNQDSAPSGAKPKESSVESRKKLGVGHPKVERARSVSDRALPGIKEAVKSGEMSINKAYKRTQVRRE